MTNLIASSIEISSKVHDGQGWLQQSVQVWKPPASAGEVDPDFHLKAEYYVLTSSPGRWRDFRLGQKSLREPERLLHDLSGLLDHYPGLAGRLLADERFGTIPYEVIAQRLEPIELDVQDTRFQIPPALRPIRDAIHAGLVEHYQHWGIPYQSELLARACDWTNNCLAVEQVAYTDAAATNLMVDLNLEVLNQGSQPENQPVISTISGSLRDYDQSMNAEPGCLPSLRRSALANPIGVAGIGITSDNRLLLSQRSRRVSSYAGRLGPSASGYLTWQDVEARGADTLTSVLEGGLRREIAEELSLDPSLELSRLQPLGFYRELYRAGMPQGFFCFRIRLPAGQLVQRMLETGNFGECSGILAIPVDPINLPCVTATLVHARKVGAFSVGLEAQGLLAAWVVNGGEFID